MAGDTPLFELGGLTTAAAARARDAAVPCNSLELVDVGNVVVLAGVVVVVVDEEVGSPEIDPDPDFCCEGTVALPPVLVLLSGLIPDPDRGRVILCRFCAKLEPAVCPDIERDLASDEAVGLDGVPVKWGLSGDRAV